MYSYLKWLEENKKDSATFKIFEVLERMTKTFYKNQKYKQDERFLKKWIAYVF